MGFPNAMSIAAVREARVVSPAPGEPTVPGDSPAGASSSGQASAFAGVLQGLGQEMRRGERLMRSAMSAGGGRDIGPAELIALQAGVYRYGEAVDLASRLVDRATSGVKTILQVQ
jgi:hypothetical protein